MVSPGNVCKCRAGKLGVVTQVVTNEDELLCYGIGFDGKHWQSKDPKILAKTLQEYMNNFKEE